MSKKIVLHIGANKTGTSSIQRMLLENRPVLQKAGWDYPDYHLHHMAHHRMAYSIAGHTDRGLAPGWRGELRKLIERSPHKLIFSSELFFRTGDPAAVAEYFPPEQTQVVLYLREHLAYMMSWYAQAIQERNLTASFDDYLRLFPQAFSSYLKRWENIYGRENITARVFDRPRLKGQDSRSDFVQFLDGVDFDDLTLPTDDSNLSISGNLLFFKKVLNNYISLEESRTGLIIDEIGAFAGVKDTFRGKFHVPAEEANVARNLFSKDLVELGTRGLVFPEMASSVDGHRYPDFDTLRSDFKLIKDIAVETDKTFLKYTDRWPDWQSL